MLVAAEQTLKTVKLASTKYYDTLPTTGNDLGMCVECGVVCCVSGRRADPKDCQAGLH